ncbi:TIGR01777 family oxidoreductase [Sandaracinus amylolyticus]|nr:TIGR01777 family oxidoreductase [Sandaracinus amylolyticus]
MERLSMLDGATRMTEPGMRILITGVTGLVGARLAAQLLMSRVEIVALSRDPARAQEKVAAVSRAWKWSPELAVPEQAVQGLDAVVHLAGESVAGRWTDEKKRAIEQSRVEGTRRVVEAIAALPENQRPYVLVSASAIGYYGETGERDVREGDPPADDFLAKVCVEWEREAMKAEALGVRVVTPRLGLVMSPEGGALQRMLPIFKMGFGGKLGSGRQWWPWIHLDDVIGILQHAIAHRELRGAINATSPSPVRQSEFADVLGRVVRRPSFLPAPAFAIKTALGEFGSEVLGSRKVLPTRALESGYRFKFRELEPALRDLLG